MESKKSSTEESSQDPLQMSLSVRGLAEHVHRTGGLSSLTFSGITGAEGTRLHKRVFADLQKQYTPENLEIEVALEGIWQAEDFTLVVRGRADCLLYSYSSERKSSTYNLIELKSYMGSFDQEKDVFQSVHWAQVKIYAHLLLAQRPELGGLYVTLRYVAIDTLDFIEQKQWITPKEAESFFEETCQVYFSLARSLAIYQRERDASIQGLGFPYHQLRSGQKAFMQEVVGAISQRSSLFVEAPTGIGKTISTLFPAIKCLGHKKCERIFYLTAKTATRHVAEKALHDLADKGLYLRSITLQAKENLCLMPQLFCDTRQCAYANEYYRRLPEGIKELLPHMRITPTEILAIAQKHCLCPHELSLDISLYCDVIIGDYNHAFNPRVKLDRYFNQPEQHQVLLVDEAHNLVDRSRDMYSASLSKSRLVACQKALLGMDAKVDGYLADVKSYFQILCDSILREEKALPLVESDMDGNKVLVSGYFRAARSTPRVLYKTLWKFCYFVRPVLDLLPSGALRKSVLDFFFEARFFLTVLEQYYDDAYIYQVEMIPGTLLAGQDHELTVSLVCLDASAKIRQLLFDHHAAIFFSATLSPAHYYTTMILGDRQQSDAKILSLASPFPPENLEVGLLTNVKTTYQERQFSALRIAESIVALTSRQKANFLIYLPSFAYLKQIAEAVKSLFFSLQSDKVDETDFLLQTANMSKTEKELFLLRFEDYGQRRLLAFAVLGGHFGEGIDLVGERLGGVIVVGVGLPQLNPQREIMKQYFQEKFGEGFAFAYRFPGWEKVLQAAGRVIRNEDDTGFVLLMDERYDKPDYHMLFPEHWRPVTLQGIEEFL